VRRASGECVVAWIQVPGRNRRKIDYLHPFGALHRDQHVADSTEAAVPGFAGSERETRRHRRVDCIATGSKHLRARLGCEPLLACDNAAA
jgi:hypothetical protein